MNELHISKRKRCPSHPGHILKQLYIDPLDISITSLSEELNASRKNISQIINKKTGISTNMAIKLSRYFKTTPELWINLQTNFDLWHEYHDSNEWKMVKPCKRVAVA